ncbi:MAG TPA: hypothetical protein DCG66_05850 [Brevundimonas sp.]|nr:hypothetical protein [Brevundimonas sp.]
MRRGRTSREGMALLTVLLLVAVMAAVAVVLLDDVRFSVRRTTNADVQAQAQWYAAGAESLARRQIADLIKADPLRTPLEPRWNGRVLNFPIEEGAIRAVVTDGQACFNLNSLVYGQREDLFARPEGAAQFIALGAALGVSRARMAAAAAALTWKIIELIEKKKVSLIGMLSGVVAGLVAITPAAGFVDPKGAVIIGLIAGPVCYISSVWIKKLLRYDDSLDAFGIHGAGGLIGALLTGVFATTAINSLSEGANVGAQAIGLAWTIAYSAVGTFIILVICKFTTGLRVSEAEEAAGLDTSLHGEALEH